MVKGITTIYLCRSNKRFSLKFCVGSWVWHEILEEGQRTLWQKHYEDEDNSLNSWSDNNYQVSSEKFWQIKYIYQQKLPDIGMMVRVFPNGPGD